MPVMPHEIATLFDQVHGYGNADPTYIFLGMEERCDDPAKELEARIRLHVEPRDQVLLDVAEYHRLLDEEVGTTLYEQRFVQGAQQPTWRGLIRLRLCAAHGEAPDNDGVRDLQRTAWGRSGGDHALVEYSPIASPGQNEWHTDAFAAETLVEFPWLNTRTETMARLAQQVTNNEHPLRAWLGNLRRSPRRRVVVAYGKGNWPYYEALLSHVNAQWEDLHIAPEALPARYKSDGTTLVLLVYGPSAHIGAAQGRPARAWHNEHWHRLGFFVRDWLQQA